MNNKSAIISEMIKYYAGDVKRINHFMKVYGFAETIGEMEKIGSEKQEALEIAAILHDIGIKVSEQKYNSSSGKYQQLEGPEIAEDLLKRLGFSDLIISRVSYLVGHHHTYTAIDDIDFQILVEADFLINIFEDEMSQEAVCKIRDRYFRTNAGLSLLKLMYFS